jgi:16S rRNA (uracil1498-N3)-methyltransferase
VTTQDRNLGLVLRAAAKAQVFVADLRHPTLTADDDHHLTRVLRLRTGESVIAADGQGRWRACTYVGLGMPLEVVGEIVEEAPPTHETVVAFAPVKGDRPEWAFSKLVELGVDTIVLLMCDRSVVKWGDERGERHRLRLDKLAVSAAGQCRRVTLPKLVGPMTLNEAAATFPTLALGEIGGDAPRAGLHAIAIGPEGGWSAAERSLGLPTVSLGATVLRAETATVVGGQLLTQLRSGDVVAPRE